MNGEPGSAPAHGAVTLAGGAGVTKYLKVAEHVRAQVRNGTLAPGQPVPSGAELASLTGYSPLTCRKALRALIKDGTLVAGPSSGARPRVPSPAAQGLANAARALSAALAAHRRAAGLTQPEFATLTEVSTTTIGHAETGRLWQGRPFWERADNQLSAGGRLLRLHDAYRAATAADTDTDTQEERVDTRQAPQDPDPASRDLLTPDEREAVRQAGQLYTLIADSVISDGPSRGDDLAEIRAAIHHIQRAVLAHAAARAYPHEFRLLGGVIAEEDSPA
jgi:DNA-binding transcriptional regulator YhcF (GntR family)